MLGFFALGSAALADDGFPLPTPPLPPVPAGTIDRTSRTSAILGAIYPFTPSPVAPFQFQPTLDGVTYNVIVRWNIYGQRYYINVYTLQGVRVTTFPVVGSPLWWDITLTPGLFTTLLVYRAPFGQFEVLEPAA